VVFVVRVRIDGGGRRKDVGVVARYSRNLGNSLLFRAMDSSYSFYIDLFALNHAAVTLLPSATIEDYFKLEGAGLFNVGYGYIITSKYEVRLSRQGIYYIIYYYVKILDENVLLSHYNAITRSFALSPVSFLF